jgi:hypothetical protein
MNRDKIACIGCMIFLCFPTILLAKDAATLLAPVLDDQTFAVVRVRMTPTQPDPFLIQEMLADMAENVTDVFDGDLDEFRVNAGHQQQAIQQAGVRNLYFVFSLKYIPGFLVVAPTDQDPIVVMKLMKQMGDHIEAEVLTDTQNPTLVVAGQAPVLARLKAQTPATHKLLAEGLACGVTDSALQVVVAPSADQKLIIKQMVPLLPLPSGSIPLSLLIDNIQWAAIEFQAPPDTVLSLTTQSPQDSNTARLLQGITDVFAMIEQYPPIRQAIPRIDMLRRHLMPRQQGRRLSLKVDLMGADAILKEVLASSLMDLRRTAKKRACQVNMRRLNQAMRIYANDYDDTFPPTLSELSDIYKVPQKTLMCPAVKTKDSYVYRAAGVETTLPPKTVLLYEKQGNHHSEGRHVMFNDTSTEWVTEARFQELIRQDNANRREKGLPELAAE